MSLTNDALIHIAQTTSHQYLSDKGDAPRRNLSLLKSVSRTFWAYTRLPPAAVQIRWEDLPDFFNDVLLYREKTKLASDSESASKRFLNIYLLEILEITEHPQEEFDPETDYAWLEDDWATTVAHFSPFWMIEFKSEGLLYDLPPELESQVTEQTDGDDLEDMLTSMSPDGLSWQHTLEQQIVHQSAVNLPTLR
ncbi:hypothetical protein BV25DRAFT_1919891 [Artomyces pyxidatus]|uniref:Uncharacterized protein n=1 Tax=Artomyces pyxidatus TaxID=48021 RepID=A0ACB8SML2_9AGAM|nr:hypothetical protein BV25DRAFT_1919891 [Artomyces pyxidatus]